MNRFVSLTVLVIIILQLIGSVGSFLNSLPFLWAVAHYTIPDKWKMMAIPVFGLALFLIVLFYLVLAFVELALGGVGLILSYGLWKQKAWAWISTFVLQILIFLSGSFYSYLYLSSDKKIPNTEEQLLSLNISRIIISISILLIHLCLSIWG